MDGQRIVDVNGVDLCVDTIGDAADPAILLISGMGGSMDWWEEEFCQRLAAGGRFVIRYDHRDTGRSVSYPAGRRGTRARTWRPMWSGCWTRSGGGALTWLVSRWAAPSRSRLRWLIPIALTRWY